MLEPMDAPRRTLSIGPITISIRREGREDDVRHIGPPTSLAIHILVLVLVVLLSVEKEKKVERELEVAKAQEPIAVTFIDPLPPPPPKTPPVKAAPQKMEMRQMPPPPSQKPLRMQPAPDTIAALKNAPKDAPQRNAGKNDSRPAGGQAGGPLPKPADGVPDSGSTGYETNAPTGFESANQPKDLEGRLRQFQRAVEEATPPARKGPKGGGHGTGGIEMPQMPETGFGVGNLEFEGRDFDWADYGRQIYWVILRAWYRRLLTDSGVFERWASENRQWVLDHKSRVRFTIDRGGKVVDIAVEGPSGCYPLDDSAREALQEVVLPPLPDDFPRSEEVVHARFIAEGEIRVMRVQLQQLHDAGWF
jgi:TonB family protein